MLTDPDPCLLQPDPWVLLHRVIGAAHAITESGASVISFSDDHAALYPNLAEDAWVIDATDLLERTTLPEVLCLNAPLPDPKLPDGHRAIAGIDERILHPQGIEAVFLTHPFLVADRPLCFQGLDCVALDVFAEYWRCHGAHIGRRRGPAVVWEGNEQLVELLEPRC